MMYAYGTKRYKLRYHTAGKVVIRQDVVFNQDSFQNKKG